MEREGREDREGEDSTRRATEGCGEKASEEGSEHRTPKRTSMAREEIRSLTLAILASLGMPQMHVRGW